MILLYILVIVGSMVLSLNPNGTKVIKIGVSLGKTSDTEVFIDVLNALYLRANQLNRNTSLISGDAKLELVWRNNFFEQKQAIRDAIEFSGTDKVVAIIGGGFSRISKIESYLTQYDYIPMCCGSSTSPSLIDKKQFPNFFRTVPNDNLQGVAMAEYVKSQGWSRVAILYSNDDYGNGLTNKFAETAQTLKIQTVVRGPVFETEEDSVFIKILDQVLANDVKIIVFMGFPNEFLRIVKFAKTMGLWTKDHVWIASEGVSAIFQSLKPSEKEAFEGSIMFLPVEGQGNAYKTFEEAWKKETPLGSPFVANWNPAIPAGPYSHFFISCLDLMVLGFDQMLKSNTTYTVDGLANRDYNPKFKIPDSFSFPDYETATGKVTFDNNAERVGYYDILNVKGAELVKVGVWSDKGVEQNQSAIVYIDGSSQRPKDTVDIFEVALFVTSQISALPIALGSVGIVSILGTFLLYLINSKNPIIVRSSIRVGYLMMLALLIIMIQPFVMLGKPTNLSCSLDAILVPLGFSMFFGALFAKTVRLYRIFYGYRSSLGAKWTDSLVLGIGLSFTIPVILLVIGWLIISKDPPVPMVFEGPGSGKSGKEYYWACSSQSKSVQSGFVAALISYNAIILLLNLNMAFKTRGISSQYKETKLIGLAVYNVTVVLLFTLIILLVEGLSFISKFYVKVGMIFYLVVSTLALLLGFRLYLMFTSNATLDKVGNGKQASRSKAAGAAPEMSVTDAAATNSDKHASSNNLATMINVNVDGNEWRSWKYVTRVHVKNYVGKNGIFGSILTDYQVKYMALSADTSFFIILNCKRESLDEALKLSSQFEGWMIKYVNGFDFKTLTAADKVVAITVDKASLEIKFDMQDDLTNWTRVFQSWAAKTKNASGPDNNRFLSKNSPDKSHVSQSLKGNE